MYAKVCKRSCQWQVVCIPKYAIKAAGGRFYVCQSMQEKLPVAGSLYNNKGENINEQTKSSN